MRRDVGVSGVECCNISDSRLFLWLFRVLRRWDLCSWSFSNFREIKSVRENLMQLVFVPKSQPKLFPFILFRSPYLMRGKSCARIERWENKSQYPWLCIDNRRRCGINEPIYPSCYQSEHLKASNSTSQRKTVPVVSQARGNGVVAVSCGCEKETGDKFLVFLVLFCLLHVWINLILFV